MASLNQSMTMDGRKAVRQHVTLTLHFTHGKEMQIRSWLAGLLCSIAAKVGGFKIELVIS